MLNRLFRTKSLEQLRASAEEPEHQLSKSLGTFELTMFGIGAIIGAGIFSSIGTAAAGNLADGRLPAGPALVISKGKDDRVVENGMPDVHTLVRTGWLRFAPQVGVGKDGYFWLTDSAERLWKVLGRAH